MMISSPFRYIGLAALWTIVHIMMLLVDGVAHAAEKKSLCTPALNLHKLPNTSSVDGAEREYHVYVPSKISGPVPVVYAFHGATSDPLAWLNHARLTAFASLAKVVLVVPVAQKSPGSGEKLAWYAGDKIYTKAGDRLHHDDTIFIRDLINVVDAASCTSTKRFAIGYSSGSGMATTMSCMMSEMFRGAGGVGAAAFDSSCDVSLIHRPLINIHNENDQIVSFALSKTRVEKYAARNQCTSVRRRWNGYLWAPSWRHEFSCPVGSDVVFHSLESANPQLGVAGHAWPTQSNHGRNATRVIFEFFGLL